MSLLEIKNYLMQVKMASLSSLCTYFNCDSQLVRNMLTHWIRKGCIRQAGANSSCQKKCSGCVLPPTEIYEWVGNKRLQIIN